MNKFAVLLFRKEFEKCMLNKMHFRALQVKYVTFSESHNIGQGRKEVCSTLCK